jgi:hypothetical protein
VKQATMDEKTVVITERNETYQIQNNGISDFALLGILECIVFNMKSAAQRGSSIELKDTPTEQKKVNQEQTATVQKSEAIEQKMKREVIHETAAPDIRIRISNAIKAIRGLGARIEDTNLSNLTDEELQSELEELTEQYKRLKSSKANK